jgi:cytoskeletal protein RodZ
VTDPGSVTGTIGGRAALRAERQAAEAARKKATRGSRGEGAPDGGRRRSPRRAVLGLVAVAVVALGVLGVYSYASPHTQQAAAQAPATPTAGPALGTVPGVSDLPPLSTVPAPTSAAPATPVRVPVTVLNSTNITGLAASIAGKIKGAGWQTLPVGAYDNTDVAATTVYFTKGDEKQRQSALQLIEKFPHLQGPAVRFFSVPASAAGGLVVVATGDWKP